MIAWLARFCRAVATSLEAFERAMRDAPAVSSTKDATAVSALALDSPAEPSPIDADIPPEATAFGNWLALHRTLRALNNDKPGQA